MIAMEQTGNGAVSQKSVLWVEHLIQFIMDIF